MEGIKNILLAALKEVCPSPVQLSRPKFESEGSLRVKLVINQPHQCTLIFQGIFG